MFILAMKYYKHDVFWKIMPLRFLVDFHLSNKIV